MKISVILILLWFAQLPCPAQQVIRPLVGSEFGRPVLVTAEFVAKPNTYYSQNIVPEPFILKVISVNGRKLQGEVLIEYKLETEMENKNSLIRKGVVLELEAYETLYQPDLSTPWLADGQQGMAFSLIHILHIRPKQRSIEN